MSYIGGDNGSVTGAPLTPREQADAALFGSPAPLSSSETEPESAEATLVDVTPGSAGSLNSGLEANVPPDMATASALVSNLATQIGQQGTTASSAHSLLSAAATLKLTK